MVNGLTEELMVLATQTSPTDDGEEEEDGLSTGIVVVIVVLVVLIVLLLVIVLAGYFIYRQKHKSKYVINRKGYAEADYISDNTLANPAYFTVQQTNGNQVQEMVSTEPNHSEGKSSTEINAAYDDVTVKANVIANDVDDDKDTHL